MATAAMSSSITESTVGTGNGADGHTTTSSNNGQSSNSKRQSQSSSQHQQSQSSAAAATASLQLLLREDFLLKKHELHVSKEGEEGPFTYAAALLQQDNDDTQQYHEHHNSNIQAKAKEALAEVDRKLALVESLAERVSRTSPEAVAGPLMSLHGYSIAGINTHGETAADEDEPVAPTTTLVTLRERCSRLQRQGDVLEGIAKRVESSLTRGLKRMETTTCKLSRVLDLSATLKMILRLQFESTKLQGYDLDDLRDLTRAAASVAVVEDLLSRPELTPPPGSGRPTIDVVESMRPNAKLVAASVRKAANTLLKQHQQSSSSANSDNKNDSVTASSSSYNSITQLGATLQVYYHLGELPQASWTAVEQALEQANQITSSLFNHTKINKIVEKAQQQAKAAVGSKHKPGETERMIKKKLKEIRTNEATKWSTGIYNVSLQVWNLHRVLSRKSDPVTRQVFISVVSAAPIPEQFKTDDDSNTVSEENKNKDFSIFGIFWTNLCRDMGEQIRQVLEYDNGKLLADVAGLYPVVRSAALDMLGSLYDTMQAGGSSSDIDDKATSSSSSGGILGGSACLDDAFLKWSTTPMLGNAAATTTRGMLSFPNGSAAGASSSTPAPGLGLTSADTWTRADSSASKGNGEGKEGPNIGGSKANRFLSSTTTSSLTAIFQSSEWRTLQGEVAGNGGDGDCGLFPLQQAFIESCSERLCTPLQYMFPVGVSIDDDTGVASNDIPILPSKYDLQKLDQLIRQELTIADHREGGGELSMTSMIAMCIVDMVKRFSNQANGAMMTYTATDSDEEGCLKSSTPDVVLPTSALTHNLKVSSVMSALSLSLRNAPENAFVVPYRPSISPQHEEAASLCSVALLPALHEIESVVRAQVLTPLCRSLNRRVSNAIAKMHHGTYLHENMSDVGGGTSFVQKYLSKLYDGIASNLLSSLPTEYAGIVAATVSTYSIYTFVSNIALIRPLSEAAKLHITQDLADFELALEQFVFKGNDTLTLSQIDHGKPYAELRAARQMLFWTGLEDANAKSSSICKSLLREVWVKDVRPSTVLHFLFSFGPSTLSSPHTSKRMKPNDYVKSQLLVNYFDNTNTVNSINDCENNAWMVTMSCCDTYQQRISVSNNGNIMNKGDGDRRVTAILMMLGPELLRRRRH